MLDAVKKNLKGRLSMRLPWMDQYSNIGADQGILSNLNKLDENNSVNITDQDFDNLSSVMDKKSKSLVNQNYLEKYKEMLSDFDELSFSIFEFEKKLNNRRKVLPLMTLNAMDNLNLINGFWDFNMEKLAKFLNQVQSTYMVSVQYHNDMHGADVMHMCYYFLKQTRLVQVLDLSELD